MRKQAIICKVSNFSTQKEFVYELYNSMRSSMVSPTSTEEFDERIGSLEGKELAWWERLQTLTSQLEALIRDNHSLIPTEETADLLIVWKEDEDEMMTSTCVGKEREEEEVIHIAVLEVKKQSLNEWEEKLDTLMSPMCILYWLPLFYPHLCFSFHFIFGER
jgi:hypothetical protein